MKKVIKYLKLRSGNIFGYFFLNNNEKKKYFENKKVIVEITDPVTEILYLSKFLLKGNKIYISKQESFPFKINNTYRLVFIIIDT